MSLATDDWAIENVITTTDYDAVERPIKLKDVSSSPVGEGFASALEMVETYLGYRLKVHRVVARYVVTDENRSWPLKVPEQPLVIVHSLVDQNGDKVQHFEPVLTKVFPPMPSTGVITWGAAVTNLTITYEDMLHPPIALAIAKVAHEIYPVTISPKELDVNKEYIQAVGGVEKLQTPREFKTGLSNEARHLLSPYQKALSF